MKFTSPLHRGTTCWWMWPGTPAPAQRPKLMPMLKPCGEIARFSRRTHSVVCFCRSSSSTSVSSSSSALCDFRADQQVAVGVREEIDDDHAVFARPQDQSRAAFFVAGRAGGGAEEAFFALGVRQAADVLHSPGRLEVRRHDGAETNVRGSALQTGARASRLLHRRSRPRRRRASRAARSRARRCSCVHSSITP